MSDRTTTSRLLADLGLPSATSATELRKTYKKLVKQWHPDRFEGSPEKQAEAQERLKRINLAYGELKTRLAAVTETADAAPANTPMRRGTTAAPESDARPPEAPAPGTKAAATGFFNRFRHALLRGLNLGLRSPARPRTGGDRQRGRRNEASPRQSFQSVYREVTAESEGRRTAAGDGTKKRPRARHRARRPGWRRRIVRQRSSGRRIRGVDPVSPVDPVRPSAAVRRRR